MALGLLAKLIMSNQLRFEGGQIELKNTQMTLVPTFFIGELMRYFYDTGKLHQLYFISWLWGFKLVGEVTEQFKLDTPSKVYNMGMNLAEAMGIGLYKTAEYQPGRYTHFIIADNPFLKFLKDLKTTEPLDVFIAGCMGGGGCFVHGQLTQCLELKCRQKKDPYCEFLTATEEEYEKRGLWEEVNARYPLENILPLQQEFYSAFFKNSEELLLDEMIDKVLKI